MSRSGCKTCPVVRCDAVVYRGNICKALRAEHGLGDPMTNADALREMTDEQLCEALLHLPGCKSGMKAWLQAPAGKESV